MGSRRLRGRKRESFQVRRGVAALALGLALAGPARGQEREPWTERREEAQQLVDSLDLAAALASGEVARELLLELLEAFGPTIESDELSARIALEAAEALRVEAVRGRRAPLYLLWVRALIATGQLEGGARAVYGAGVELLTTPGETEAARELFDLAQRALPEQHELRYFFLYQLIVIATNGGELDQALELIATARASLTEGERADLLVSLRVLRARIYMSRGLTDRSEPILEAALAEAQSLREEGGVFLGVLLAAYSQRAVLRLATGRHDLLIEEVEQALRDLDVLFAELEAEEERLADEGGEWPENDREREARSIAQRKGKIEDERPKLLALLGMSLAEKATVEPGTVEDARDTLLVALDAPRLPLTKQLDCELALGYLAISSGDGGEAERWITAARGRDLDAYGPDVRGWVNALDARLSLLRDADRERLEAHRQQLAADVEAMLEQWTQSAPRPGGQAFLRYGRRRFVVGELMALTMLLDPGEEGELAALEVLHGLGEADSLVRLLGGARSSLAEARSALLGAESGALIYFTGKDRSHVFAVDARRVVHADLPQAWILSGSVRDFGLARLRASADPGTAALERRAAELAGLLLPPDIRARTDHWSAVTIVGADLLDELPFEHLPFGERTLGEEKAVSYLSSLMLGKVLLERGEPGYGADRATALCFVGDVLRSEAVAARFPGLEQLPLEGAGADDLTRPFGGAVDVLLREDATLARLGDGRLDGVRLLHLFTHGLSNFDLERPSGLLLSFDREHSGATSCVDIERLRAPPLVVLSACGTGRGPARKGSGLAAHLGGAFLFAGARAVVLSDEPLRYEPTLGFMEALHEALASGATVAEAARQARVRLTRSRPVDGRIHGSSIRVIGLGNERPFEGGLGTRRVWPWLLGAGALALAGVLASRYARRAS